MTQYMVKHTPGPWTAEYANDSELELHGADGSYVIDGCGCCGSPFGQNFKHDIPLIAAAPDLLEALKLAQVRLFMLDGSSPEYKAAGVAISKATGEPS